MRLSPRRKLLFYSVRALLLLALMLFIVAHPSRAQTPVDETPTDAASNDEVQTADGEVSAAAANVTTLTYGKKGVGDPNQNRARTNLSVLDFDWYYTWQATESNANRRNSSSYNWRFVRTIYCRNPNLNSIRSIAQGDKNNGVRGRVWLVFNEPDHWDQCGKQYGIKKSEPVGDDGSGKNRVQRFGSAGTAMARDFVSIAGAIKGADPHAKVFAGGFMFINLDETRAMWHGFVGPLRRDGNLNLMDSVHIHVYPYVSKGGWNQAPAQCRNKNDNSCRDEMASAAKRWYRDMLHAGKGFGNKPIWITETGIASNCAAEQGRSWVEQRIMRPFASWFDSSDNPGYDSIAWFVTYYQGKEYESCTFLMAKSSSGSSISSRTNLGNY